MRLRRLPALARRHWLLTLVLAVGLALRVLASLAYRPALIYIDSLKYLVHSGGADPLGYRALLYPLTAVGNLDLVAAVQHLLGLGMGVTIYLVSLRRGAPRWLAALAAAPVLLDAYQLQLEQTIMPDVMFEALIVAGLAVLLWQPRPPARVAAVGCLLLGASATVRQVGEILIVPALAYLLVTAPRWRPLARRAAAACAAFALPILGYCTVSLAAGGHFRLSYTGTDAFYGRLVLAVGCRPSALPPAERPLCPPARQAARLGVDGLDHNPASPLIRYHRHPPAGTTFAQGVSGFNQRLLLSDPAGVAAAIGKDALKLFAVVRVTSPGDTPIRRWQFQDSYPYYPTRLYSTPVTRPVVTGLGARFGGGPPRVAVPLASFLRAYQLHGGYTPGPLLAASVILGAAGSLSLLRRRASPVRRDAARACLLVFASAAAVLIVSDAFEFSWRYQLPAVVTLPLAAALAVTALSAGRAARPAAVAHRPAPGRLEAAGH